MKPIDRGTLLTVEYPPELGSTYTFRVTRVVWDSPDHCTISGVERTAAPCKLSGFTMVMRGACEACGHNSIFHPGNPMPNPGLTECLACTVILKGNTK